MIRSHGLRGVLLAVVLGTLFAAAAEARSGCCSHHGGVCGCACCDGSPLSDICAPYYPNCGGNGGGGGGGGSSVPSAPSGLNASLLSSSECSLSWTDNSSNETSFRIEWRGSGALFHEVSSVGANVTSARIGGLTANTTYAFRVRASNATGDSAYTNEASVTTPPVTQPEPCVPSSTNICLSGGRFKVEATWQTPDGVSGAAHAVKLTDDSGYLWFFNSANVEAIIKVLNGCSLNGRIWFFAGGLTNVKAVITLTDGQTGMKKTYLNPQNTPFAPIQDTTAFSTCP